MQRIARCQRLSWLLACSVIATACSTAPVRVTACPPLVVYDSDFADRMVIEIRTLPEDSALISAMADYLVLRDQVRRCQSE